MDAASEIALADVIAHAPNITESYLEGPSVIAVASRNTYRLTAVKDINKGGRSWSIEYERLTDVPTPEFEPTYPTSRAWVRIDLPWVAAQTAEDALRQGLGWLGDKTR